MPNTRGPRGGRDLPGPSARIGKSGAKRARGRTRRPGAGGVTIARGSSALDEAEGPLLTRSARTALLSGVEGQIEEIWRDIVVQMKRMEQLHAQVDEVRGTIRELTAHAETP